MVRRSLAVALGALLLAPLAPLHSQAEPPTRLSAAGTSVGASTDVAEGGSGDTSGDGSQDAQRYRVDGPDDREDRTAVARTGAAIDEVGDAYVVVTARPGEVRALERPGYAVSVLAGTADFPPQDSDYHDYAELSAMVDQVVADHPELASRISVGRSHQGRDLIGVKISNNVHIDEDEPEVLFTANQHAREHLTAEMAIYLLDLFTDSYGNDSEVTQLVDSREIWILPMVNPDGVEYDMDTGSYRSWRKTRQPNPGSVYVGTDMNRNWDFKWGCCNGSSGNPASSTYRGSGPESATEVSAVADFVRSRVVGGAQQITTHIDFHTFGELILWPMGYTYADTTPEMSQDEHDTFETIGRTMGRTNGYTPQQASDLYVTDGSVNDWMWAVQGIFSYTFEMYPRSGGFYPPDEVIPRETERNRDAVVHLMEYADCPYRAIGKADQYCASPDPDPDPDPGPGPAPDPGPDPDPGDCNGLAAWGAGTSYQPGDQVSHDGSKWEATWWSTGAEPGGPHSHSTWENLGSC